MTGRILSFALLAGTAFAQSKAMTQGAHRMELTLERRANGAWRAVDPGYIFANGDYVRFRFRTNFNGYLYVLNHGTAGSYEQLFPREDTGMANRVENGKDYIVPATEGAFKVAGPPGHDVIYWMVTPVEMRGAPEYKPLPPPPAPSSKLPASLVPRCDDAILKARGECVDSSAGPQNVEDNSQLPENMKLRARGGQQQDLIIRKKQNSALLSSPVPLSGPVTFEFRLAHK